MRAGRGSGKQRPSWPSAGRLKEEIAVLEQRLEQIGPDGDCGYERALIRFLGQQIVLRRALLTRVA